MEADRQRRRSERRRAALDERQRLGLPIGIIGLYEQADLVEDQAGTRPERNAQRELVAIRQSPGGADREGKRDSGHKVVDAQPSTSKA